MKAYSRAQVFVALITACILGIISHFNACSEVEFAESLSDGNSQQQGTRPLGEGEIRINGGDLYTRFERVQLSINPGKYDLMLLSDNSDCSGGQWEEVRTKAGWKLSSTNDVISVYAKFKALPTDKFPNEVVSNCTSDSILHDNLPPRLVFNDPSQMWQRESSKYIGFNNFDLESGLKRTDCAMSPVYNKLQCENYWNEPSLDEGSYVLAVHSEDRAGNVMVPKSFHFGVDWTPPTIEFTAKPANPTSEKGFLFRFSAMDQMSGIKEIRCSLSELPYKDMDVCSVESNPTKGQLKVGLVENEGEALTDGDYRVYIMAIDNAGNLSELASHGWSVDSQATSIVITKAPDDPTNNPSALFEFEEEGGGTDLVEFYCRLTGPSEEASFGWELCNGGSKVYDLSDSSVYVDGKYKFEVYGKDSLGNQSGMASRIWTLDRTPPVLTIVPFTDNVVWIEANASGTTEVDIVVNIYEEHSPPVNVECWRKEKNNDNESLSSATPCGSSGTAVTIKGDNLLLGATYTYYAVGTDGAGNVSEEVSMEFTVLKKEGEVPDPAQLCGTESMISTTIPIKVENPADIYNNRNWTCQWNKDGNLGPQGEKIQARFEQRYEFEIDQENWDKIILCDVDFQSNSSDWEYDDIFMIALNGYNLVSSWDFNRERLDPTVMEGYNLYLYDWDLIKGAEWEHGSNGRADMEGNFCLGREPNDPVHCKFPKQHISSVIDIDIPSDKITDVMKLQLQKGIPTSELLFVTFGDNDTGDCQHDPLELNVKVDYVINPN